MSTDIGLKGYELNVATSLLFVTYILFEVPTCVILKVVGPSKLIPTIVIIWSIITIATAFVKNYGQLVACRMLLGLAESGLFPCLTLYLGQFYYRNEQAKRTALLFVSAALSGAINGLLSYGIIHIKAGTLVPWQWLYVVEGLISLCVGIAAIFFLPDRIEKARFLNAEEKALALKRREINEMWAGAEQKFQWSEVVKALKDGKLYLSGLSQFGMDTALYGFGTFLPSIIRMLGFGTVQAYLLTIPVYVLGAGTFLVNAVISDRIEKRAVFILCFAPLTVIGYAILVAPGLSTGVYLFACFLVSAGMYTVIGLNLVWLNVNQAGHYKRASALGFQQAMGNSAGILAGQLYQSRWSPHYQIGHGISLGCMVLCIIGAVGHTLWLRKENAKRDAMTAQEVERILAEGGGEEKMGDFSPTWRYKY